MEVLNLGKIQEKIDTIDRISAEEFADKFDKNAIVIDVRKEGEYAAEHVEDAFSKPLAYINDWLKQHQ
jgi:rhodanese-related sulfurtransferase